MHARMTIPRGPRLLWAVLSIGLLGIMGCASRHSAIAYRLDASDQAQDFRRIELHPHRDFFHHWTRTAYRAPEDPVELAAQGKAQATIVEQWGAPDFVRKPFRSLQDERVDEWLYVEMKQMFQFVGSELVYAGPLTDVQVILLQKGYPDRALVHFIDSARIEEAYVYRGLFGVKLEQFYFANGKMVQSKEGD